MTRRRPGLDKARKFLAERIAGTRVSTRELARQCDVSYVTMWKALQERGKSYPGMPPAQAGATVQSSPRWRATFNRLRDDLTTGHFTPGAPLPKAALLLERYGVSHPTLRRAMALAVTEGLVGPYKRTYRAHELSRGEPFGTVCIVVRQAPEGELHSSGYYAFVRTAEQACAAASVRARVIPCAVDGSWQHLEPADRAFLDSLQRHPNVLGSLFILRGLTPLGTAPLVERFVKQGSSVALLGEQEEPGLPTQLSASPLVRYFPFSVSPAAGHAVGRLLAALGHRGVAFLGAHGDPAWSVNRWTGLRQALVLHAGDAMAVRFAASGPHLSSIAMSLRAQVDALVRVTEPMVAGQGALAEHRRLGRLMRDTAEKLIGEAAAPQRGPSPHAALYEQVLADRRLTAWVGANDEIALDAMRFLAQRGVAVPQQVSVVGFDDTEEAFLQQLTSYNFSAAATIRAMVMHVVAADRFSRARQPQSAPVEIEGYISQRRSTAPPGH